jgi:DNA-directed RNA polymerase specialized sigma24 family protein
VALAVLRKLRPERAEVLVLHDVSELSVPEIAGRLKLNENTAKSRLCRAREDVRVVLRQMGRAAGPFQPFAGVP